MNEVTFKCTVIFDSPNSNTTRYYFIVTSETKIKALKSLIDFLDLSDYLCGNISEIEIERLENSPRVIEVIL